MTAPSSWITFRPPRTLHLQGPQVSPAKVSVVIPVRDNQIGLDRLLESLAALPTFPGEVIVVDNLSRNPVHLPSTPYLTRLAQCMTPGPAAARNVGARLAIGEWVWFLDSDCVVHEQSLSAFVEASSGHIGMCSLIKSLSNRLLARYYESQEILLPQFAEDDEPLYLITASALVHRSSFLAVGGFDESFPLAAGEDIDLGFRLFQSGRLAFVPQSTVFHRFEEDTSAFIQRFHRYGIGNRILAEKHGISLAPAPFVPNDPTFFKRTLAKLQFEALASGYAQSPVMPNRVRAGI